jgi:hypothetical protein
LEKNSLTQDGTHNNSSIDENHARQRNTSFPFGKIIAWFCVYLIVTGSVSTIFAVLASIYSLFPTTLLETVLTLFYLATPLVLMAMGIASILPLSEYAYMRQGGINPTIARESVRHQKRKTEKKDFGVLLGVAGLTSFFKISPWDVFFLQAEPTLGLSIVAFLMIASLALLALIYKKRFRRYIKFDT